jgi:4-hydroxybenzoate polyprenyltransferase
MILCDLRDRAGDRRTGIRSLPVWLGEKRTRLLLVTLLAFIEALGLAALAGAREPQAGAWLLSCILAPLYLGGLLIAMRAPRSERFYEWAVEGMLFLPAIAVLADAGQRG